MPLCKAVRRCDRNEEDLSGGGHFAEVWFYKESKRRVKNSHGNQRAIGACGLGKSRFLALRSHGLSISIFRFRSKTFEIIVLSQLSSSFRKSGNDAEPISLKDRRRPCMMFQ